MRLQTGWLASWLATRSLEPGSYVAGVNGAVWLVGEMELSAAADILVVGCGSPGCGEIPFY